MSPIRYPNANYPTAYDEADMGKATDVAVNEGPAGVNEVQSIWNDATGGTFTLSFDGQGPTGAINFDDDGSGINTALELLSNIAAVTVTGAGTVADPWLVEFTDPGVQPLALMTAGDGSLTGHTIGTTIAAAKKGVTILDVVAATNGPL